jgi:molecular chaperone HtpG
VNPDDSFKVGIDFEHVLRAISKQIYETHLAFIRENVQNAVDALRIQAHRDGLPPNDTRYRVDVSVYDDKILVRDNGVGMSATDLRDLFWTIGASGKRTQEAQAAGCVGMFGIGGFANFGVCHTVEVISQTQAESAGTLTRLGEQQIRGTGTTLPTVHVERSLLASPRGTLVVGHLRRRPDHDELRGYLREFVRFVPVAVFLDGELLSQDDFAVLERADSLTAISSSVQCWTDNYVAVFGRMYEDSTHTLVVHVESLAVAGARVSLSGQLRLEYGFISLFKRGFKLCATSIGTVIGMTGRLDCDRFVPTAGRDSPDGNTLSLLNSIMNVLQRAAVETILESGERIAQHTRIFQYVASNGLAAKAGRVTVILADGSESTLEAIRRRAETGGVGVFYGFAQKQTLNQVLQARGHVVVLLSGDWYKQQTERAYLEQFCNGKAFDGVIDCAERYLSRDRFESIFLSELEANIARSYEVDNFQLISGRLTEDIPAFFREGSSGRPHDIFVDVRHYEVTKLRELGFTQIFYSLIATFCREYLGPSLKKWSPRFFGDGALNLDLLAKRRSELWILLRDDIGVVQGGQRQVVTRSDVQVINIGTDNAQGPKKPRLLQIVDLSAGTGLSGYYIRLPDSAFAAYGDLIPECESRGVVWAGNKILYVASDTRSAAFQYEIRLDEVVAAEVRGVRRSEGALELEREFQQMYEGLYFPVPRALERFLVPQGDAEIRLELHCDWIDMRTAKHWRPKPS